MDRDRVQLLVEAVAVLRSSTQPKRTDSDWYKYAALWRTWERSLLKRAFSPVLSPSYRERGVPDGRTCAGSGRLSSSAQFDEGVMAAVGIDRQSHGAGRAPTAAPEEGDPLDGDDTDAVSARSNCRPMNSV